MTVIVALGPMATWAQVTPNAVEEKQALAHVRTLLDQGRNDEALRLIEQFLDRASPPSLLDRFAFFHAAALQAQGQEQTAIILLEQFLEDYPSSALTHEARLRLGTLYTNSSRPTRAIPILSQAVDQAQSPARRAQAQNRLRLAYERTGDDLRAIHVALTQMREPAEDGRRDLSEYIRRLILQRMSERSLNDLLDQFPNAYPGDLALIRLIEWHAARGDTALAERDIRTFLQRFPTHPYARTAGALLRASVATIKAHRLIVAAVLPLSGNLKPFGIEALHGIRLALERETASLGSDAVGLVVKDSTLPPIPFRREVSRLIEEFDPIALIGPLSTRRVRRVADVPDRAQVPFITPAATLPDVQRFGRYWFSTAMTPLLQVQRVVEYVMQHFGYTRFCILAPRTAHGKRLTRAFQRTVIENGGEVMTVEWYRPGTTDATKQLTRIKEADLSFYGNMLPPEPAEPVTLLNPPVQDAAEEERLVYTPGFDALFLPGRPTDVAFLSAQLAFLDVQVPLIGTNGWNHPDLLTLGRNTLEGGVFGDALFLHSPEPDVQRFIAEYRERFQTDPSIFAGQAYDAMRIILEAINREATTGPEIREHFARCDLPTLGGMTRFGEGGILDRKVYMIQIRRGQFIQANESAVVIDGQRCATGRRP